MSVEEQRPGASAADAMLTPEALGTLLGIDDPALFARLAGPSPQQAYTEISAETGGVMPSPNGGHRLMRAADILALNRTPGVRGSGAYGPSGGVAGALIPIDLDGEIHRKFRKILDPIFAPRPIRALEDQIRRRTLEVLDEFADASTVEVYAAFCAPLPSRIFLSLMGLPQSQLEFFLEFKNAIFHFDPQESAEDRAASSKAAASRFYTWLDEEIERRDALPGYGTGVLADLMGARLDGERLDHRTLCDLVYFLMLAGLDTISASLSCMLSWLARHPDVRRRVVADPALWPKAVEELLRFETPVPAAPRYCPADVEVNGRMLPAGSRLVVWWSGANLDPEFYDDPLTVDLDRPAIPHFAFGSGFHRCVGSHLARLELRIALEEFHRRFPDYEIADPDAVQYTPLGIRSAHHLPLRLRPNDDDRSSS